MAFMEDFRDVFDHPDQGQSSAQKLLYLHQGSSSVEEYILTSDSSWNKLALLACFREGLNAEIQLELLC